MTKGEFTLHLRHSRCKSGGPFLAECISGFPAFAENDGRTGELACTFVTLAVKAGESMSWNSAQKIPLGRLSNTKAVRGLSSNYGVLAKRNPLTTSRSVGEKEFR